MGLFDRFRKTQAVDSITINAGDYFGAWKLSNEEYLRILGLSPAEMWRTQPYLRIVVNFMARNIAQLGLQTFQRVSETDRRRLRDGGMADALREPNRAATSYELVYGLVADLALYDTAYWLLSDEPGQRIVRLPVPWVTAKGGDVLGPERYEVRKNDRGEAVSIPAEQVLAFHGWHPGSLAAGSSPMHALKEILAEQVQAARYREHVWRRGGKVGAVLSRPANAPKWSEEARKQFKADWDAGYTGDGPRVGGTPLLEDGMSLERVDFNAREMEFIEGARLALNTTASVYHIPPPMIGLLDNANYANVREFRKMLYGDTLGPVIGQIEDRINAFLVPRLDTRSGVYVEFNVEEKLQGNFEEQAQALQSSVGAPYMTRNEARALRNLPALDGGNELVTPLNVLVGGQASPRDSGTQNEGSASGPLAVKADLAATKARATEPQAKKVAEVLRKFFGRQSAAVLSALGGGGEWWDKDRWDAELADDLHALAVSVATQVGASEAEALGFDSGDYDADLTVKFLRGVAERYAVNINTTTKTQLDEQVAAGDEGDTAEVFETATSSRSEGISNGMTTFLAAFATHEAAKQIARGNDVEATKTWVTGANPRPAHAAMNGETVGLDKDFSNGLPWPGAAGAGPEDNANCNCTLLINLD